MTFSPSESSYSLLSCHLIQKSKDVNDSILTLRLQMADPLTALMYAVQVMNFLKTLILRTLRERKDSVVESSPSFHLEPSVGNAHHITMQSDSAKEIEEAQDLATEKTSQDLITEKTSRDLTTEKSGPECSPGGESGSLVTSSENPVCDENLYCEYPPKGNVGKSKTGQSSNSNSRKGPKKSRGQQPMVQGTMTVEKTKGTGKLSRINSRAGRSEP